MWPCFSLHDTYRHEISYQYESYRYDFIPVTVLERHNLVLVRLSYRYDFHTGTTFIQVRLSYRYDFHTGTTFVPVRLSYRYDFHTGTTFIPVRDLTCKHPLKLFELDDDIILFFFRKNKIHNGQKR